MRGKITFRAGLHPSRKGGILDPVAIGAGEWRELEKALGAIDDDAREDIGDMCAMLRDIASDDRVSSADIRESLNALACERDDEKLLQAVCNCDADTRAQLDLQLYRLDGPDFWKTSQVSQGRLATKYRAAALLAEKSFEPPRGKKKHGWQRLAAEYAIQLAQWRGLPTNAHARNEGIVNPSPIVAVLQTLLGVIDPINSSQSESWCVKLLGEINARRR